MLRAHWPCDPTIEVGSKLTIPKRYGVLLTNILCATTGSLTNARAGALIGFLPAYTGAFINPENRSSV